MNIWQFMSDSPWLTFLSLCVIGHVIFLLVHHTMRHWTIRKQGYPPPHCDADGEFREEE